MNSFYSVINHNIAKIVKPLFDEFFEISMCVVSCHVHLKLNQVYFYASSTHSV